MSRETVKVCLSSYAQDVDFFLGQCFKGRGIPCRLVEAMEYSLLAGGKRLRPALCLAWGEMFGAKRQDILPFACGIECVHTYSLIHDDLPAMDNDDLRRGKPSSHKKFDEATAILAGDGLLTEAFHLMLAVVSPAERIVQAVREFSLAAGGRGMVGGQLLDMSFTGKVGLSLDELQDMHAKKTGAIIRASCVCGAILAGADSLDVSRAARYGESVGLAFQVVDDILDVIGNETTLGKPVGSDEQKGKNTYPALVGLEKSYSVARESAALAVELLDEFKSDEAIFLGDLARYIVDRVN